MNGTGDSKQTPTWAWIVGVLVPVVIAMGSYIFTSTATKAEANAKIIDELQAREHEHDVSLALIKQSLVTIQREQAQDSRTIEAIARKLNVITFEGPDR